MDEIRRHMAAGRSPLLAADAQAPAQERAMHHSIVAMAAAQAVEADGIETRAWAAAHRGRAAATAAPMRPGPGPSPNGAARRGRLVVQPLPSGVFRGEAAALVGEAAGSLTLPQGTFSGVVRAGLPHVGVLVGHDGRIASMAGGENGHAPLGRLRLPGGAVYSGMLRQAQRHGFGREVSAGDVQLTGRWHDDVLRGPGARRVRGAVCFGTFTGAGFMPDPVGGR